MSDGLGGGLIHPAGGRRWSRRNWWGLAAILPLLVAVVVFAPDYAFQTLREQNTEQVVRPGGDGWASYGGARLRLAGFGRAELVDGDGEPFSVPGGLTAWRVTVGVDLGGGDLEALIGCDFELEDTAGRRYSESPQALAAAYELSPDGFVEGLDLSSCTPPYDAEDETAPFETVGYFLLPESTEPVALRVSQFEQVPAYVRLDVG
jgi:hypothetical protein